MRPWRVPPALGTRGKARPMPPELAAGPGGKASLRDPAAVQLQQRALRCLEARSGDARHLLAGEVWVCCRMGFARAR